MNDTPLHQGEPWSLGAYIQEVGGVSVRAKKAFGIYAISDEEEELVSNKLQDHVAICHEELLIP